MRLYVIGPVSGFSDDNLNTFEAGGVRLERAGYDADIPHDFVNPGATHEEAMLVSINHLTRFDPMPHKDPPGYDPPGYESRYSGVALLPGWEQSEGAKLEKQVAEACGIPVKTVDEWLEEAR